MDEPVRIRINYSGRIEETDAIRLGPGPGSRGELFRVRRPSLSIANVGRDDVVLLDVTVDPHRFLEVVEPSSWRTFGPLVPREALGSAALDKFRHTIEAMDCILEDAALTELAARLVISTPADVPVERWGPAYDELVRQTGGISAVDLQQKVEAEARRRWDAEREDARRRAVTARRQQVTGDLLRLGGGIGVVAAALGVAGWWTFAMVTATPGRRPIFAALAMVAPFLPHLVLTRARLQFAAPAAAGILGLLLAQRLDQPVIAAAAVALGVGAAAVGGAFGVVIALFSGFASSAKSWREIIVGVVLPALVFSIAGVAYAVSVSRASPSLAATGPLARVAGVVLTGLALLGALRRRKVRDLGGTAVMLVLVWTLVWLFGGTR